ncbi:divalent metal cation transporter, partial [Pseudomonas sp. 57B-090624]|uniref:divalent metal cation transporter n=2 Tax=Pseudomonas TaxID=286 RepID=UPI000DB5B29C
RALALVPALIGVVWLGEGAVGKLLVLSQVVLSLQLPFALWPLIRFTSDRRLMGPFANSRLVASIAWSLLGLISLANLTLLYFWMA